MAGEENDRQADEAPRRPPRRSRRTAGAAGRALHHVLQFCVVLTVGALIAAGLIWLRLAQGPVEVPFAARAAEDVFNAGSDRLRAEVGDVVLTLGEGGEPSGVQFRDVRLSYASGEPLFLIPRLSARFHLADLLRGQLRPIEVAAIEPEARLVRAPDGAFRFGLGEMPASVVPGPPASTDGIGTEAAQTAAIGRLLDGLAGEAEPIPELSRLREVAIRDARLVFENREVGRSWSTRQADLRVWRAEDGLRARVEVGLADAAANGAQTAAQTGDQNGAHLVLAGRRLRGSGGTAQLEAWFRDLRPEHLAEQVQKVSWLSLFDARLDGHLAMTVHPDGRIEGLEGRITAGEGRIRALGDVGEPFDSVALAFAYEPGRERMRVTEFHLTAPAAEARLTGFADLVRSPGGEVAGLAGQFEVAGLSAELPEVFADPLSFDSGQVVARLDLDPLRILVAPSHLRAGDLVLEVEGEAHAAAEGWRTDLRAAGRSMTIGQLVGFWPHVAAGTARRWVEENIPTGRIDGFLAQMRFAGGTPRVNLDFTYSGLEATYLGEMTPIVAAEGRGSLTLESFDLIMESGEVRVAEDAPVRLDGSALRIPDLGAQPTVAEITLRGQGATSSVLALIDQEPLRLTSKLGLEPASVDGQAEVTASLGFPLVDGLNLGMVAVETEATLAGLGLPFRLPGGHVADIRGDRVTLEADTQAMRVEGPVRVDGTQLDLAWTERYGQGTDHREIRVAGAVTPAFLERIELGSEYFAGGEAPVRLSLSQSGGPELAFDLEADLGPALLEVAAFDWSKSPGGQGQLVAQGSFGGGVRARSFRLETEDFGAEGAIGFGPAGRMRSAEVSRLRFLDLADVSLEARRRGDGGLAMTVGGRRLDLALFERGARGDTGREGDAAAGEVTPMSVDFNLDELRIAPSMVASPGRGTYDRAADGRAIASLDGMLSGRVPFTADYGKPVDAPASVTVRSQDAGALLAAAGLFGGAKGGQLRLKAELAPEEGVALAGAARIRDVRIQTGGTFRSILEEGGADEAARAAETGGLAFDRVNVPFEYRDGVMVLGESVAKGNMLAVKVEGTVDQTSEALDLVGVISPAYGLTGALDSVPLLGTILSGGEGEGIVAMTFNVGGTLQDPDFSVNPLSLLTPGILRNVFSGRAAEPDPRFLEQLERKPD